MTGLSDLLTAHRDELLVRWRARLGRAPELGEQAAPFLTALAETLRQGHPVPVPAPRPGFDRERVLAEYAVLHALVLELAAPGPLALEDVQRVADFFHRAVAWATHRSEAELGLLLDSIPVLVSFVTAEERYGRVNHAYLSWFGLTDEQMRGRKVREVIGEAAYAVLGPYVRRGLAGEHFSFEQHGVPYRLGGTRDVKVSFMPHRGADDRVEGYVAMLQDVTQLRRLEREREEAVTAAREAQAQAEAEQGRLEALSHQLAAQEQLLRLVVEGAGLSAWAMDCRTRLISADARFLDLYGIAPTEPVPLSAVLDRMHPEDRPGTARAIEAALAGEHGGRYVSERRIRGPSGAYLWGETRAQVSFAPDGTALTMRGVSFDITVRKEAEVLREQALQHTREESERQRLMFEQAPAIVALLEGPEHRFRVANARYLQLVGGRELLGLPLAEALPEVAHQGFVDLLDTVRRTGEPYVGRETWLQIRRRPEGPPEDMCLDFVYQPIRDASGQMDFIFVHAVEVTDLVRSREGAQHAARELERAAERVRESEQRLQGALTNSGAGTWELDPRLQDIRMDGRMRELFGLSPDASRPLLEAALAHLHPEDVPRIAQGIHAALAGENGGVLLQEYRVLPGEGQPVRWLDARGQVTFDAAGAPVRISGTAIDATPRKVADAGREGLLASLAEQEIFGVCVLRGQALRYEMANAVYRRLVGPRELLGRRLEDALPELVGQGMPERLRTLLHTGQPLTQHEQPLHIDVRGSGAPELRFHNASWQPIRALDGSITGLLVLTLDVTDSVRARERAEALAQQESGRADFAQQLIGIVSHDLRNPLAAISLGAATLQRRGAVEPKASRTVERILASTDRAERMVRDLLDFTQARLGGGLKIERRPADLHDLTRGAVQEVQEARPGVRIRHEARGDGRGAWDADRLQQVVQNLVTNALKYGTADEPVDIRTEAHDGTVTLSVHNRGEPIPPERQASIFQPMQRGVEGVDRQGRSVGLGLFIVRAIAQAHGGEVQLSSRADEGTTFQVVLPREAPG
ncbi:PAS domain-containing protein [Melittangium boletus]|uniref:PAS domain-containing sensor histidine kinase n=1 Tax=Melittangium boletus TaxID=83453 RepID=UPI003DA446F6